MKNFKMFYLVTLVLIAYTGNCAADDSIETRIDWSATCIGETPNNDGGRSLGLILASVLGPKIIAGVVDAAATALKSAGERKELVKDTAEIDTSTHLLKNTDLQLIPHCLSIVRGKFKDSISNKININEALADGKNFPVIFQARIELVMGRREPYFQLVPWYLKTGVYEKSSFLNKKNHEYTFAISLRVPGAEKPFASTTFGFIDIPENKIIEHDNSILRLQRSSFLSTPPILEKAKSEQAKREAISAPYWTAKDILKHEDINKPIPVAIPSPYQNAEVVKSVEALCQNIDKYNSKKPEVYALNDTRCAYFIDKQKLDLDAQLEKAKYSPSNKQWAKSICANPDTCEPVTDWKDTEFGKMTTEVVLVESRPGSKFAAFLGTALGASKDDIANKISDQIIPSRKNAIEDAESDKTRLAKQSVVIADYAVEQAEAALNEKISADTPKDSEIISARIALVKAKISANQAYRTLGLPLPFPELG